MAPGEHRVPVLYLAPWADIGGADKGTLDWFRFLDRDRFRPSLITTQPSPNRRLAELTRYAEEVWNLPELMQGNEFARFIVGFIHTRGIRVLHIMNSRLGFELLPDIAGLPERPRVVVQLHVEEPDSSGYVRYVTTRYGNLVDAFSVSSQALSDRLSAYDVPVAKRRLIRTGVDAEREFSPDRVRPVESLHRELLHILSPVRITAQKDPFLMVQVAARLHASGLGFCLHVLGEGDLTVAVRRAIDAAGLRDMVVMHGGCLDMAPWYAACDIVLLTSAYEGVPYAVYEAMAMGTPVVAPDLPGISELITPEVGVLVAPRQDPQGYVTAVHALAAAPSRRKEMGALARARARSEYSLERMAAEHGALYDELLGPDPDKPGASACVPSSHTQRQPPAAALRSRQRRAAPLVSVIVPCFNDGRYLADCLQSVAEQTYAPVETIVVDDASTDPETIDAFARIEAAGTITVLRMATNRGPSTARNAAIERARGRYILPLDADNVLLPGAISILVEQLSGAGERIGFVYPNYQFFGNRKYYFEPPSYNLDALLAANYCDTSSLIDGEVFDRGLRYPEDVVFGQEDWDLVLSMAEAGIYGEPARAKTLLYRKHGFTRSDLVAAGNVPFAEVVARRHPGLFNLHGRARLKGEWNPAVSVIALDALAESTGVGSVVTAAARQTCEDFELVISAAADVWPTELGCRLRRVPSALAASRAQALAHGLAIAGGRYALATYGSATALLADRSLIEKALRVLQVNPNVDVLAFGECGPAAPAFRLLQADEVKTAQLSALLWPATGSSSPPASLELSARQPLETLARWLSGHETVQWRHLPRRDRRAIAAHGDGPTAPIGAPRHRRTRDARIRAASQPQLPDFPAGIATRIRWGHVWTPPQSRLLCRHLQIGSEPERYVFSNDRTPPRGWSLHYDLGCVRGLPLPGTTSLHTRRNGEEWGFAHGEGAEIDDPELLGFVERAPLPLFEPLQIGRHLVTGQRVLVAGAEDPLAGMVDELASIGYIEPYPIHPRHPPHIDVHYGLVGLVRTVDLRARRHRYGAGGVPPGELAGELGALLCEPTGDCEPLWIDDDGRVLAAHQPWPNGRPSLRSAARWSGAPLTWRGFGPWEPRVRASARRAYESARILASTMACAPECAPASRPSDPAGYVLRCATSRTVPLYAGIHPVTGDQLLSTTEPEARSLGYRDMHPLGHLVACAPVTGTLGIVRHGAPWASRFGLAPGGQ